MSVTGNVTLDAGNDLAVNAAVTTGGTGTIYARSAADIITSGSLSTSAGNLVVNALGSMNQTGNIQSVTGDLGIVVGNDIFQDSSSTVTTEGNLLLTTGNDWVMVGDATVTVGGSQLIGESGGSMTLGRIVLTNAVQNQVGLIAVGDILDGNSGNVNLLELDPGADTSVSMRAGGEIGSTNGSDASVNIQALDMAVDRVAAESNFGIHLRQIGSGADLVIGPVAGHSITIDDVFRAEFNGTTVAVPAESGSVGVLEDLVTQVNGEIELVVDNGRLTFLDGADGEGADLKDDPEVVARGTLGRIDVRALGGAGVIELQDNVQFHAEKVTAEYTEPTIRSMPAGGGPALKDRAICLQSDSVVLGSGIELFTGMNQGTARIFAPRPIEYTVDDNGFTVPVTGAFPVTSAFYDASTVSTTELVQVDSRNLVGSLFVDVGNAGERGLTLDIDWGASTRRFQQLNGLTGDLDVQVGVNGSGQALTPVSSPGTGEINLEHFYTDIDLLFSRANGRTAATDPIVVRFAVRQHESILVQAGSIQQGLLPAETVLGGVISSTDNPATPAGGAGGIESGHHRFLIPNVPEFSVPVIPQREVIPTIDVVTLLPAVELDSAVLDVETTSATASGFVSVARDEYFQLRVLRPDQNAEPLGVFRLADDIMTGDKLQQLQRSLPDGRYEIEYVLGDTFSRVILRFDVRNGEPVIPEDALDEGELLLEEVIEQDEAQDAGEKDGADETQDGKGGRQSENGDQSLFLPESGRERESSLKAVASVENHLSGSSIRDAWVQIPLSDQSSASDAKGDASILEPETNEPVVEVPGHLLLDSEETPSSGEESEAGLKAVSAGVVLTTTWQRRRQKLERRILSRSARFAARKGSLENPDH